MGKARFLSQQKLHDNLFEHTLLVQGGRPFQAGQYQSFTHQDKTFGPFSILSTPKDLPYVKFLSRSAWDLNSSDILTLDPPLGQMTTDLKIAFEQPTELEQEESSTLAPVLIAGGTGISPFISLIHWFDKVSFELYWSYKNHDDLLILDQYLKTSKSTVTSVLYDQKSEGLSTFLPTLPIDPQRTYYLAGPYIFVETIGKFLLSQGVKKIFSDMKKF